MTTSQPSAKRRRSKGLPIVSVISTLALLAGIVVGLAGPATSTPLTAPARALPAAAFPAPLCEGTDYTPASFMTTIDGVRLDHYNAGNIVPMYGNTARPDAPLAVQAPVCGVRQTSAGPESEWMYCTDYTLDACSGIDPETGLPVDKHNGELGPTVPVSGHPGLTDDQNLIISWVLQNPVETSFGVADDQNSDNRVSRQALVWCVTDYDQFTSFCDGFFPASAQATILSRIQADPTMELALTDPTTGTVATGGTATFTLTTNLYETPITLTLPAGASITVCADGGNATLTGSQIVVHGSGSTPAAIRLCVTDPDGGTTELSAAVSPPSVENLHWNTAGDQCQVFASFDTVQPNSIEAAASVVFDTKPTTTTAPTTTTTVPTTTDVTTTAPTTTEPEVTTTAPTTTTDVTTTTAPTTTTDVTTTAPVTTTTDVTTTAPVTTTTDVTTTAPVTTTTDVTTTAPVTTTTDVTTTAPAVTTTSVTAPTTTKTNVVVIPIIPIIPIFPGGSIDRPTLPAGPATTASAAPKAPSAQPAQPAPKKQTGQRPTSIDGGAADESTGPSMGIAIAGLGLIGLAACGVIAIRRNRA